MRGTDRQSPEGQAHEDGSVLILLAGFVAMALLLIAVVTDASVLFLARRSLADTADGAADRAAQAVAAANVYRAAPTDPSLPLDPVAAMAAVDTYLAGAGQSPDIHVVDVTSTDQTVSVTLGYTARPPFASFVGLAAGGVDITAQASAQTQVAR